MARPRSAVMTLAEKKTLATSLKSEIKAATAVIKDLDQVAKTIALTRSTNEKELAKFIKAESKRRASEDKAHEKTLATAQKTKNALTDKLKSLFPPVEEVAPVTTGII